MRLTLALLRNRPKGYRDSLWYNNYYWANRDRVVKHRNIKEQIQEKGFQIKTTEEVISTPHMPEFPDFDVAAAEARDPVKRAFESAEAHPYYHERPAYSYTSRSYYPKGLQLKHAKALTKTVQLSDDGLPSRLQLPAATSGSEDDVLPASDAASGHDEQHERVRKLLHEYFLCDATQAKLPKSYMQDYINWNTVIDRMNRPLPYEPKKTFNWGSSRKYGVPNSRKFKNLFRGMFDHLAWSHSSSMPSLLTDRSVFESTMVRQFFERDDKLVRLYLPVPFVVADAAPLRPFATQDEVEATKAIDVEDLFPLEPTAALWPEHIYRHENNFPVTAKSHSTPHAVLGVELNDTVASTHWSPDSYAARSLTMCFMLALGQARLLSANQELPTQLPQPISVQFVTTDGRDFHFSAFQLNTLDLDSKDGVKNLFWHEQELTPMYKVCDNVRALPTLDGYNPDVYDKIARMYLTGRGTE